MPDGLYEMWVGYRSPFGAKGYDYQVDGVTGSGMFDGNRTHSLERRPRRTVSISRARTNTLRVNRGWGYYDVDYFEFRPFTPPTLLPVTEPAGRRRRPTAPRRC